MVMKSERITLDLAKKDCRPYINQFYTGLCMNFGVFTFFLFDLSINQQY